MTGKQHIRHAARQAGIAQIDIIAALECSATAGTERIRDEVQRRGGKITVKAARARYDAALPIADQVRRDTRRGDNRRYRANRPATPTIEQRKVRQIGRLLADYPGERYSGATEWVIIPCERGKWHAETRARDGEQYSRKCTYRRTDATHRIHVSLADLVAAKATGVPGLIDGQIIVAAKQVRAGIYWVATLRTTGNRADYGQGCVANQGDGRWHFAKTERGAVTALNRSLRADEASRERRIAAETCRRWGWCAQGIRDWCARHGIRRNLAARLRHGVASIILARLIKRHGGPADSYERRLILAAS